jgi:hypothetical protein
LITASSNEIVCEQTESSQPDVQTEPYTDTQCEDSEKHTENLKNTQIQRTNVSEGHENKKDETAQTEGRHI